MPLGASFFDDVLLLEFIYLVYILACQVELPYAVQVFVVVSLVCRALLFPFVCCLSVCVFVCVCVCLCVSV